LKESLDVRFTSPLCSLLRHTRLSVPTDSRFLPQRLRKISRDDIFLYQISDGTLLDPPIPQSKFTEPHLDPLFAWSMHGRPFPGEGYFPVVEISEAIFATGFRGLTVMEVFEDEGFDPRNTLLGERTNRAVGSWVRLGKELGLAPCSSFFSFSFPSPPSFLRLSLSSNVQD
jgi:hypothetical protein